MPPRPRDAVVFRDPEPPASRAFAPFPPTGSGDLAVVAHLAIIGLFLLALLAVLKVTAELVVPVVAAVIVGSVLTRIGDRAARLGLPPLVTGLLLVALTGLVAVVLVDALIDPFVDLFHRAPAMLERVTAALRPLTAPLRALKAATAPTAAGGAEAVPVVVGEKDTTDLVSGFVSGLTPALGELLVFFATLAFFVVGRDALRRGVILAFEGRETRLSVIRIVGAVEAALALYFGTTATIYVAVGATTALIAWVAGLPTPPLWGALTFLASFIPFVGAAAITLALAAGGLVSHDGFLLALWPAGGFLAVHLVSENLIIPAILGRRFAINPFVVFLAIVFFTWLWGAMGAVLAVPLLLVATTIRDEFRSLPPELPV